MADTQIPAAMKRLADWEERLSTLVAQRLAVPFAWGGNDCVTFAADCVCAMTGMDPIAAWRGQWSSQGEAVRVIARLGGLPAAVRAGGLPEVGPLFAQRGDVVLHRREGTDALAICTGPSLAAPSEAGLLFFSLEHGRMAWRV